MTSVAKNTGTDPTEDEIVSLYLHLSQQNIERARQTRLYCFRLAHDHGWSYERIGREAGLTGRAISQLLNRNKAV